MWPGVLVQNSDSLEQQHKPLAMNGLPESLKYTEVTLSKCSVITAKKSYGNLY
jgi:hypothetical protein